ncbi:MAG: YafY family protein [Halanaerobiales bacterium]|nr:YafY family protein [Defluviitaleaceae bacterium]HPT75987.1 YafY family protein [Defluviitaleaceae bacterium]
MQINRLFEMVYILLRKKTVTAKELAEHFEVSTRTIYRDLDTLSSAGIPIYTSKGKGGGISLIENYVLKQSLFSEEEQKELLMSLQGLNAINTPNMESILNKLSAIFNQESIHWIDVDFSGWGNSKRDKEKFKQIKEGIFNKKLMSFDYFSSSGEKTIRLVEPLKLFFKGQSWYLYAFCRSRNDFRFFKLTRMKNLNLLEEQFERKIPAETGQVLKMDDDKAVKLVLKIDAKMAYRVYDEFDEELIKKQNDGTFIISTVFPEGDWLYSYILSYGSYAEVLEPERIRLIIMKNFEDGLKKYL